MHIKVAMLLIYIKNSVYQFLHERGSIERTGTVTRDAELKTHQRSTTQEVYKVEGVHGHLPAAPLYLDRLLNILCFSLSLYLSQRDQCRVGKYSKQLIPWDIS